MGKLGDLCTRQCDGCNIKATVLPLRQPHRRRRRHRAIAYVGEAEAARGGTTSYGAFGVAAAAASTAAVTAITVQSLLAVWLSVSERKLLTFFFFSPFSRSARLTAEGSGKRDGIIKRDTFSFVPAKLFAHCSVDFCPVG